MRYVAVADRPVKETYWTRENRKAWRVLRRSPEGERNLALVDDEQEAHRLCRQINEDRAPGVRKAEVRKVWYRVTVKRERTVHRWDRPWLTNDYEEYVGQEEGWLQENGSDEDEWPTDPKTDNEYYEALRDLDDDAEHFSRSQTEGWFYEE